MERNALTCSSFSARLPQQCDAINKKLGGPVIVSPPKPKSSKHSSSNKAQKPGASTKRQMPAKQPRTLQRALSTDLQHRRSRSEERRVGKECRDRCAPYQ